MFSVKRLALPISLLSLLISLVLIVPAALTSQGSAESSIVQYTTTPPDPSLPLPVKEFEVEIHFNYHILSDGEIETTKQNLMKEDKFKERAKKEGLKQAEKELDARIKADNDYMKKKNQLGSEKIPMLEIGEHSAYTSKYTYNLNSTNQCTVQEADPVHLFFYDTGYIAKVSLNLTNTGWSITSWGDNQCAFVSNSPPGYVDASMLQQQTIQMSNGLYSRDHIRMWEGGYGSGSEGRWSIGAAHRETISAWELNHCLVPFDPDGSSFDSAEYEVWNNALGSYPHYFWNAGNARMFESCGHSVWNDGTSVSVHITSNTLNPGEKLAPGMARYSTDGRFAFIYQTDGNLVLYQIGAGGWYPIWHINRYNYPPGYAVMWSDGNLAVYTPDWYPMWYSNTGGNSINGLFVQNDGNVVIYNTNWVPIWATNTCCR